MGGAESRANREFLNAIADMPGEDSYGVGAQAVSLSCPVCNSESLEENTPEPGEYECRICGWWGERSELIERRP